MTGTPRKPKTAEQKERDRILAKARRIKNKDAIRAYNVAKHAARKPEIEARKEAKREAVRQHDLWGQYEKAWMAEMRPSFPDWRSLARKKADVGYSRKKALEYYHRLSPDDRRLRNQRLRATRSRESERAALRKWRRANPEKARMYVREANRKRKLIDPGFRVQCNLRNRFKDIMGSARRGGTERFSQLIGCTTQDLANHLERQFQRGMSWENYGSRWHVDHVMPCASFDHTRQHHIEQCWHWTNLQPLWAEDNLAKSDKITSNQLSLTL